MSSQSHELETSGFADNNAMTNPPPMGGGSEAGAQESSSTSDIELEYNIVPLDKGKGKAVPDNTAKEDRDMTLLENGKEHLVS